MKSILVLTILTLPCTYAASVFSAELHPLQKRAYNIRSWSVSNSQYRSSLAWGSGGDCHKVYVPRDRYISWPVRSGKHHNQVSLCTFQDQMAEKGECSAATTERNRPQDKHDCPSTWQEFVLRIVERGNAAYDGYDNWEKPIGLIEAIQGAKMLLPPEAFEPEPATIPTPGVPNRDHMSPQPATIPEMGTPDRSPLPPGPVQDGIVGGCLQWHMVVTGDSCYWIAQNNGVALEAFYAWNPKVNEGGECNGLWLGYAYCVKAP